MPTGLLDSVDQPLGVLVERSLSTMPDESLSATATTQPLEYEQTTHTPVLLSQVHTEVPPSQTPAEGPQCLSMARDTSPSAPLPSQCEQMMGEPGTGGDVTCATQPQSQPTLPLVQEGSLRTEEAHPDVSAQATGPQQDQPSNKQAAEAATRAFLMAVTKSIQTPLAAKTTRRTKGPAPTPTPTILRRSRRIAANDSTPNVRPSKKGEVLLMRKLGVLPPHAPAIKELQNAYEQLFDQPLSTDHLAAIRDLFPAAEALDNDELTAALMYVGEQVMAS